MSDEMHTYVACKGCGIGIRASKSVAGRCNGCAEDLIEWLRDELEDKEKQRKALVELADRAAKVNTRRIADLEKELAENIADAQDKALAWGKVVLDRDALRDRLAEAERVVKTALDLRGQIVLRHDADACDADMDELESALANTRWGTAADKKEENDE